jgi:hypothetical protein
MIGHSQLQPQTNLMQRCQINQDFRVAKGWAGRKGGGGVYWQTDTYKAWVAQLVFHEIAPLH